MIRIAFLFTVLAFFSSCNFGMNERVKGNGNIKTEARNADSFHGVDASNAVVVIFTQGAQSIKVETDENLQEYVRTEVENGILHVWLKENTELQSSKEFIVYVASPKFDKLDVSGASRFKTEGRITVENGVDIEASGASYISINLKAPIVNSDINGASELNISGETKELNIEASGASKANGFELATENAKAEASGASSVNVFASVKLEADASGASSIRYKGNPTLNSTDSGAGSVKKAD